MGRLEMEETEECKVLQNRLTACFRSLDVTDLSQSGALIAQRLR